ncbi:FHA domain-containing protein [Ktedonosporobacter rubrisoli]|nr:FHA domain-containing protein [Ktedonosporobacter rubrisoli]
MGPPSTLGSLKFLAGPLAGNTYPITKPIVTIGREPGNDIPITDPSISRHHAQLTFNQGVWSITKLAQQNTVLVNQRNIQQTALNDRDTITLGAGVTFMFQMSQAPQQQGFPAPGGQAPQASRAPLPPQMGFSQPSPVPQQPPQLGFPQPSPAPQQNMMAAPPPAFVAPPPPYVPTVASSDSEGGTMRAGLMGSTDGAGSAGPPMLEVSTNTDREKQSYPLTKQVINIGRDPANDIVINRPTVSGYHAQIVREGNQLVFVHPHPARGRTLNGITYQGHVIRGDEPFRKVLSRGDVFRISDEHGTLVTLTYNDGSGASQELLPEIRPYPLGAPVITIGRLPDNNVVLNHPQVSGYHAQLERVQDGYRILDKKSTNHVFVNAQRVTHQLLKPGDEIRIGPFKLTYTGTQLTQHDESNGVRIDALHLKKVGNKQVVLINDVSITIPPRKFVALVGGSGAGKSTLLDALNGLRPANQGLVLYNGQDYYRHLASFSTQLGYVPQDDIIHRDLTVEHALYYAAKLRLPDDFTEAQIKQRINEVLDDVDMTRRRDLLVSKLSGGQRKRVSIALELLANPNVFFLDEPTSGLDPGLDRKMMLLLRRLADRGRTIVLVTHATNNINSCDYVCFLCQGGRLAYFGPPEEAKAYFGKTDFAEIYSALEPTDENPNIPAEAEAKFQQSADYQRYVVEPISQGPAGNASGMGQTATIKPPKRGNPWKQFVILSLRYMELLRNDTGNLLILLLQAPIIAVVLFLLSGSGTFDATSIATCPLRANPLDTSGPITSLDCRRVVDLLNSPQGDQFAAQQGKSKEQLLQDAIAPGSGGDAQKILFIMAFAAVMFGCINGVREIVKEAPIFHRERNVNLGIVPYMFSKIVVLGLLCLVQSFVLVFLVNLKAHFQTSILLPPFIEIYITMALTSVAGLMTGLVISALVPNSDRAMSMVPLALLPQVIFAGVVFSLDSPPALQILGAFFPARWAMAGMGSTVGLHGDKVGEDAFSFKGTLFTSLHKADAVPGAVFHLLLVWAILLLMIVLLGVAIAWFLKQKDART